MRKSIVLLIGFLFFSTIGFAAWAEPPWAVEVRTGKTEASLSLDALCEKLLRNSPYRMEKLDTYSRETGLSLAKDLFGVFGLPYRDRAQVGPCLDGKLRFADGSTVMDVLIRVLDRTGAKPQDIGTSAGDLRLILLKDLGGAIAWFRLWEFHEGRRVSQSDDYNQLMFIVRAAIENWGFTPKELGLTADEVAKAKLQKKG